MTESALTIRSLKDKVSPEEWAVRVDLAACYRLVSRYGWEDLVFAGGVGSRVSAMVAAAEMVKTERPAKTMTSQTNVGCSRCKLPRLPLR